MSNDIKNELKCIVDQIPLVFEKIEVENWREYKPETAKCGDCDTYYERWPNADFAYMQRIDGFVCTKDGSEIKAIEVSHPIHEYGFGVGSGQCMYENIPYCVVHEKPHSGYGRSIDRDPRDDMDREIFKKMRDFKL